MAPTMYMCLFLVPGYQYTVSCRYIKFGRQKFNPSSVKSCAWYVLVFLNVPIISFYSARGDMSHDHDPSSLRCCAVAAP